MEMKETSMKIRLRSHSLLRVSQNFSLTNEFIKLQNYKNSVRYINFTSSNYLELVRYYCNH